MHQVSTHYVTGLRVLSLHDLDSKIFALTLRTVHPKTKELDTSHMDFVLFFMDGISAYAYRDAIEIANKRIECERDAAKAMAEHAAKADEAA